MQALQIFDTFPGFLLNVILCRLDGYDGYLDPDDNEVFSVEWVSLQQLEWQASRNESLYTPWLLSEMQRMHWLHSNSAMQGQTAVPTVH